MKQNRHIDLFVPIGLFIFLIFCFFNYLNFVAYDIYAVSPLFLWTSNFFIEYIKDYFMFNNYLSLFFVQFFHFRIAASIVMAFLFTALFITSRYFFKCFSVSKTYYDAGGLSVILGVFLIIGQNIVTDIISLLIVLWSTLLLKKTTGTKFFWAGVLIVNFGLWWAIQPFFIIYIMLLPLVLSGENKKIACNVFVANFFMGIVLYSCRYFFGNFMPDYTCWAFISGVLSIKYASFFLLIILMPVALKYLKPDKLKLPLLICILILLCINGFMYIDKNQAKNTEAVIKYRFINGEWDKLLDYAINKQELSQASAMCVNYALYKKGHLTNRAFSFDQYFSANGLLPEFKLGEKGERSPLNFFYNRNAILLAEIYYDMGLYSMSEKIATDFLAHTENQPQSLLFLTKVYLARGEKEAASKYAVVLAQNPIYGGMAKKVIQGTEEGYKPKNVIPDDMLLSPAPDKNLYLLLTLPWKNKMALEYYITYSLLQRDFQAIPFIIEKLTEYGYTKLPYDFEHFIYIAHTLTKKEIPTGVLKKDPKRQMQFSGFFQTTKGTRSKKEAEKALSQYYGSYMYYFFINK